MVKALSRRELLAKLRALGFSGPFPGAKHQFMLKGALRLRIPNPHGEDVPVALIRAMLRQARISPDDWDRA